MTLRVNGEAITDQAIEFELKRLVKFYSDHMAESEVQAQMDLLRRKARDQAVGARLLLTEARRLDIAVPADDVESRLQKMIASAGGREKFAAVLRRQNLSEEALRRSIEEGRRVDLLIEKMTADAADPTEQEIREHYEAHRDEYIKPEEAQARHVLLRPHAETEQDRAVARSRLMQIRDQIENGADFAELAAAHSDCPSGRRTGGSLGWVPRGAMVPEFDKALFALKDGELSDIVETSLGFHLIRRTAGAKAAPAELHEVREKIRDFLRHARRGEALAAFVAELREKAVVEED